MKKCPYCGMQNEDENLFCTECGKPIPQGRVCPHCGASVNDDDAFCSNCGKKVDEQPASDTSKSLQKICPHCGAPINEGDVFCSECGKKIDEVPTSITKQPKCPHCGASMKEDEESCSNCGKSVEKAVNIETAQQEFSTDKSTFKEELIDKSHSEELNSYIKEEPKREKKYTSSILVGLFIILILSLITYWWYHTSSSGKTYRVYDEDSIEVVSEENQEDSYSSEGNETTINVMNSTMPSVQKLGMLFNDMDEGKSSALKDYGFTLEDKRSKMIASDYDEEGVENIEMTKETYSLKYKIYDSDGYMKVTYVSAKNYGEPSMSIICDEDSWGRLKLEAESTLKEAGDNSYYSSSYSYIIFRRKGQIEISCENSISW